MLLAPAKKKIATLIIASKGKPDYVQAPGEESKGGYKVDPLEDEGGMGLQSAMEDLIKAVSDKNASAAAEAFKYAMQLCDSAEDQAEGE